MSSKKKRGPIIAVDGPSGVGKSTVSRLLAQRLGLTYIDTGAMYRALALGAVDSGVDISDDAQIKRYCSKVSLSFDFTVGEMLVDGVSYSDRLREQKTGELASIISTKKPVRELLTGFQRDLGSPGSVVMEGRDIGTVVFPDADAKFFLDASHEVRARRRHGEVKHSKKHTAEDISKEIQQRDERDSTRKNAPLKRAEDAVYVDTGDVSAEEVVDSIISAIREKSISIKDARS